MIECTSLTTGASLDRSSILPMSIASSSCSFPTSDTASSTRVRRPISAEMSSAAVAAGRTVSPVIIDSSSIVITFVGSAIASSTVSFARNADRQRVVVPGHVGGDQVDGGHVDVEHRQIDIVDAEALGERAGELVVADYTGLDQNLAGGAPQLTRCGDGVVDRLAAGKSELDDDVADQPLRAPPLTRRDQSARAVGLPFGPGCGHRRWIDAHTSNGSAHLRRSLRGWPPPCCTSARAASIRQRCHTCRR